METIETVKSNLTTMIKAKIPLIGVETYEEGRAINLIREIAERNARKVFVWTFTDGMKQVFPEIVHKPGDPVIPPQHKNNALTILNEIGETMKSDGKIFVPKIGDKDPGEIYVLLDYHRHMKNDSTDNPAIQRKLRDIVSVLKNIRKTVIMVSPIITIPPDLSKSMSVVDLPLPSSAELDSILCTAVEGLINQQEAIKEQIENADEGKASELTEKLKRLQKIQSSIIGQAKADRDALVSAGLGLTAEEYENTVSRCIIEHTLTVKEILKEKRAIIKKSGVLEYIDTDDNASSIGGLGNLKKWMTSASKRFSPAAKKFGLDIPKGVIFIGSPGTGKSLSAKVLSNILKIPIIRLDMASMVGSLYGETANKMKLALKIAHACSPCILELDEIDKAFSSTPGMGMHEETSRTFGALLTDMEEGAGIVYVATCNSPFGLKPELLARFPKVFFVDIPSAKERREIFEIHLRKRERDPAKFDLDELVSKSKGYSGREIRNVIGEAIGDAWDERLTEIEVKKKSDIDVTTAHIIAQLGKTHSIYEQKKVEIDQMRAWANKQAQHAGEPDAEMVEAAQAAQAAQASIATSSNESKKLDIRDM